MCALEEAASESIAEARAWNLLLRTDFPLAPSFSIAQVRMPNAVRRPLQSPPTDNGFSICRREESHLDREMEPSVIGVHQLASVVNSGGDEAGLIRVAAGSIASAAEDA